MTERRVYNGSPSVGLLQSRLGCYHSALLERALSHHLKSYRAGHAGTRKQVKALGGESFTFSLFADVRPGCLILSILTVHTSLCFPVFHSRKER